MNATAALAVHQVTPPAVQPSPSEAIISEHFEAMLPELNSRAERIAAAVSRDKNEQEELATEVVAMCWANYRQAAMRGRWLSAGQMAWFAWHAVRSGRTLAGQSSVNDVLDPRARWAGNAKVVSLGPLLRSRRGGWQRRRRTDPGDLGDTARLVRALATGERENPAERARQRLDWGAFAGRQDRRTRTILAGLAEGRQGKEIANRLGVSQGRLCQVMDEKVRPEVASFFGLDAVTGQDLC